ncbi:hypothetical protein BCIN_14g00750 [Botrytis cinerea B05.10]|uniref:3-hydroxyisobutyrate dehydrogenase protein n=1 Tax=Botryotinia fuckeliana (strain B05.10) TaxID=332648 RepID=A0A384K1Z9_BOTFB|nr:hypothetical protein BCIN_14g00750 [Botrytis cinerea B05.10]ATZ56860.1 hypothetical protein BCIN_14g00750 [Botrytis cinerea B05.10]
MISPTLSPSAYSYLNPLVSLSTVTPFTFPTNNPSSASRMISVASIIGFILLLRELYFHFVSVNCLRPPYYTLSNLFRAIHITFYLSLIFDTLESGRNYRYTYFAWARLIILLFSYYTALAYGLWTWYLLWRNLRDSNDSEDDDEGSTQPGMNLVPRKILSASNLTSRNNLIIRTMLWIHAPLHVIPNDPSFSFEERRVWGKLVVIIVWGSKIIGAVYMLLKCLIGGPVLLSLIPYYPRFPGEPLIQIMQNTGSEWMYNRPKLGRHDKIKALSQGRQPFLSSLQGRPRPTDITHSDEEANHSTEIMSLHNISDYNEIPTYHPSTSLDTNDVPDRQLGPAYLCFLDPSSSTGYTTRHVSTWTQSHGISYPNYIFVSYTRLQFYTIIAGDPSLPSSINARRQAAAEQDMEMLIQFAIRATKTAGIGAFWIDYECIRPEEDEDPDKSIGEVYRICDIVRACHSMAIVVGPRFNFTNYTHDAMEGRSDDLSNTKTQWLRDWGSRLWTVPEALLCPGEHRISIYTPGVVEPELVAKRNLPGRVWDDAIALRQLIDHYESSIHLTKLELISIALECLKRRQTEKRMAGDVAYALQGLLRQRPKVFQSDSDFQAFARLSLANDSDMLLERLLCLKPKDNRAPWHEMQDVWGAKLWDITPICQISEVVENNTVILGDAKGAMVNWEFLEAIEYETTRPQSYGWGLLRISSFFSMMFMVLMVVPFLLWFQRSGKRFEILYSNMFKITWGIFVGNSIAVPWVVRYLYKNPEVHQAQARLYGIAGRPNLGRVEELMFGSDQGRLQWMEGGDSVADHPDGDEYSYENGLRSFTLIDTYTLTAIPFEAELPPSVVLAGARARGLVRMLLCSYDANTATLCKESVVRMETVVLERMPKLNRVRFALKPTRDDAIAESR